VSVTLMCAVVVAAAILGDSVGYEIGNRYGTRLLSLAVLRRRAASIDAARATLARRGGPAACRVVDSGEAWMSGTTVGGRRAIRVSVSNWQTSDSDIARALEAFRNAVTRHVRPGWDQCGHGARP
jgi:hypothetical protein